MCRQYAHQNRSGFASEQRRFGFIYLFWTSALRNLHSADPPPNSPFWGFSLRDRHLTNTSVLLAWAARPSSAQARWDRPAHLQSDSSMPNLIHSTSFLVTSARALSLPNGTSLALHTNPPGCPTDTSLVGGHLLLDVSRQGQSTITGVQLVPAPGIAGGDVPSLILRRRNVLGGPTSPQCPALGSAKPSQDFREEIFPQASPVMVVSVSRE